MMKALSAEPVYKVILFLFQKVWNQRDLANMTIAEPDEEG